MNRQRRALAPSDWPETDQRLWQHASDQGALFDAAGAGAHWTASTRYQVANGYGLWLGYLSSAGMLQANDPPCAAWTCCTCRATSPNCRRGLNRCPSCPGCAIWPRRCA
jgi:hypothetical protein